MRSYGQQRRLRTPTTQLGLVFAIVLLADAAVAANSELAIGLAREGRCDAAVPLLQDEAASAPDAELLHWLGRCQIRRQHYPEAGRALEEAHELDPTRAGLDLDLGIAKFHAGDPRGAQEALDRAATAPGDAGAELHLYQGLVALQRAEGERAASALERARSLQADAVEPVASYYAGLAYRHSGDLAAARVALERVVRDWPDTAWAEQATRSLAALEAAPVRWGSLELGFEWDDNAVLRGRGVRLPREIRGQRDQRLVWLGEYGQAIYEDPDWFVGAGVSYAGSAHDDLTDFDVDYPTAALWVDRALGARTTGRALASYGYAWVDGDPFLSEARLELALHRDWKELGHSRFGLEHVRHDYRFSSNDVPDGPGAVGAACLSSGDLVCSPPGVDESRARNRDGNGFAVGLEHTIALDALHTELSGGLRLEKFSARGSDYSYQESEFRLGLVHELPGQWILGASARYAIRPYRHATTFPEPSGLVANRQYGLRDRRRHEREFRSLLSVGRRLHDNLYWEARWIHTRNRSNAAVFDFESDIIGTYLTVDFGQS